MDEIEISRAAVVIRSQIDELKAADVQGVLNQMLDVIIAIHNNVQELVSQDEDE